MSANSKDKEQEMYDCDVLIPHLDFLRKKNMELYEKVKTAGYVTREILELDAELDRLFSELGNL